EDGAHVGPQLPPSIVTATGAIAVAKRRSRVTPTSLSMNDPHNPGGNCKARAGGVESTFKSIAVAPDAVEVSVTSTRKRVESVNSNAEFWGDSGRRTFAKTTFPTMPGGH